MPHHFCTLFDMNYAPRGIALYRSLERCCRSDFRLTILCIDDATYAALGALDLTRAHLIRVADLHDDELSSLADTRPRREFCWTCTAPLMLALLNTVPSGEIVTYLDADLAFFSDPEPVFDELGDKDILIHAHRFAPRHRADEAISGTFNVGLVAVRNAPEGRACLERWRRQCLALCVFDQERHLCGDQTYLNEWPALYQSLVILQHPGAGLGPWNIENHALGEESGSVTSDGKPLIFYHYHSLRVLTHDLRGRTVIIPCVSYALTAVQRRLLYRPYVRMLRDAQRELAALSKARTARRGWRSWAREAYLLLQRRELVIG